MFFDVIIIGAGHAGCEAALCTAKLGMKTLLITSSLDKIAAVSCNPAIGGIGKGHLVREIDAIGGVMSQIADRAGIHFRTLNQSRGPAVQATRCQIDMILYPELMKKIICSASDLSLFQANVVDLIVKSGKIRGIITKCGSIIYTSFVVISAGTFLAAKLHMGKNIVTGGRANEVVDSDLSVTLARLGFILGRFKTGTCPRLDSRSIDFSNLEKQTSDDSVTMFSIENSKPFLRQVPCYLTYTNSSTIEIVESAIRLGKSPLFNGDISGVGPRYCPSIEDKVNKFPEKDNHLIFLEPQGLSTYEIYPNGLSTSLPAKTQLEFLQSINGLTNVHVTRWGYAVEYDYLRSGQLNHTLESKNISGLYFAGQINGTTGYEEAAMQGLLAGLNIVSKFKNQEPVILQRYQAYAGVMIDDLIRFGVDEPYRMFASRVEYRLIIREDNVYSRLAIIGLRAGLLTQQRYDNICIFEKKSLLDSQSTRSKIEDKYSVLLPRIKDELQESTFLNGLILPECVFEKQFPGISNEVFEKLKKNRPATLAEAALIGGITPAALNIIALVARKDLLYVK